MSRQVIDTNNAPDAIGPYSQAVVAGNMIYTAGQIPMDPATGEMVRDDIETQTKQVLDNLAAVLEAAGASFRDVVKTTVYLTDLADFLHVNKVYGERFGGDPPARATVQVAALPLGARVEMDMIATVP